MIAKREFERIEKYMLKSMNDSAHDSQHIYRVLNQALKIAQNYKGINSRVLIASSILHDIGRNRQFENPNLCHAMEGGNMAYEFLINIGWNELESQHVKQCIVSHRFRSNNIPNSIEAKILFDSDKLDVCGALGIARTLMYKGKVNEPLYTLDSNGKVEKGELNDPESFYKEYNQKLSKLYDLFYTKEAKKTAKERQKTARIFFEGMIKEVGNVIEIEFL